MQQKAFTLIELLVVVAIIGILAAVGVVAYNGYTASAKRAAIQDNFNNISKNIEVLSLDCELKGGPELRSNGTNPNGSLKFWKCADQNTNSMSNLFMDHYHFSGFKNPINNDSATWYWGNKTGPDAEGYIIINGQPTSNCEVKVTTVIKDSNSSFKTLSKNISFIGRVSGC